MVAQDEDTAVISPPPAVRREVTDIEVLRVLSDPLRIAILRTLMADAEVSPRVMSAKDLAAALDEPQTKLYRHLKQLEDAKLIEVAETRVVSGITEQRYRTGQLNLVLSPALLDVPGARDDLTRAIDAALNEFGDELRRNLRAGRIDLRPASDPGSVGLILQSGFARRMAPERARAFRARLAELVDEFESSRDDPGGVDVHMLVGWYGIVDAPTSG